MTLCVRTCAYFTTISSALSRNCLRNAIVSASKAFTAIKSSSFAYLLEASEAWCGDSFASSPLTSSATCPLADSHSSPKRMLVSRWAVTAASSERRVCPPFYARVYLTNPARWVRKVWVVILGGFSPMR